MDEEEEIEKGNNGEEPANFVIRMLGNAHSWLSKQSRFYAKYAVPINWILGYVLLIILMQVIVIFYAGLCAYLAALLTPVDLRWIMAGIIPPSLAIFGLWLGMERFKQSDKQIEQTQQQIDLQLSARSQQRFFDAVRMLDSQVHSTQIGALQLIRQMALDGTLIHHEETWAILEAFIQSTADDADFIYEDEDDSHPLRWLPVCEGAREASVGQIEAFFTLNEIIPLALELLPNQKRYAQFSMINLSGLGFSIYSSRYTGSLVPTMQNTRFDSCDLRDCNFGRTNFYFVDFSVDGAFAFASDLTRSNFSCAHFQDTTFGKANISDVDFSDITGLSCDALQRCIYDFDKPPKNLPSGFILQHPTFESLGYQASGKLNISDRRDASCIPEFCETHNGFKPYGQNQIITVDETDTSPPENDV